MEKLAAIDKKIAARKISAAIGVSWILEPIEVRKFRKAA